LKWESPSEKRKSPKRPLIRELKELHFQEKAAEKGGGGIPKKNNQGFNQSSRAEKTGGLRGGS